ncbi:MAG: pilus assembly protein [Acidobacteriaceae bacterium]|nr:pilus assembly protein [Acidobacteriaceae bacterium]
MVVPAQPSRSTQAERGSTLIEFTLVLLPTMAILLMIIDLAWALFAQVTLQEAVREGVRFAVVGQSDAAIRQRVTQYAFGFVKDASSAGPVGVHYFAQANPTVELAPSVVGSNCAGNIVKVTIAGISISPMGPLWRSAAALNLGAVSADIVEPGVQGSNCPAR